MRFGSVCDSPPRNRTEPNRTATVHLFFYYKNTLPQIETKVDDSPRFLFPFPIATRTLTLLATIATLAPHSHHSKPDEYEKLGSFALVGLPASYTNTTRFVDPGETRTKYAIVIAGANFGCDSSREHAPVALDAFSAAAVVAESYTRIFFRNSMPTREVYSLELEGRLCEECWTGDVVMIELGESRLINHTTEKEYQLKSIGDAGPVIEVSGIFAYVRKTGMIPSR